MSLNTYPYNPFPASTDKLDEAHNAELQQEVDQLKSGLTNVTSYEITETGATGIARRFLKVVMLDIYDGSAVTADFNDLLFVLPADYRPSTPISVLNAYGNKARLSIEVNGNVVAKETITSEPLRFSATYVVE